MNPLLALALTTSLSLPAAAPPPGAPLRDALLNQAAALAAPAPAKAATWTAPAARGDSLKNGTIIGAVIGGLASAVFASILCNVYWDPDPTDGDYSTCIGKVLAWTAGGAAAGAGIGAGMDALFDGGGALGSGKLGRRPVLVRAGFRLRF